MANPSGISALQQPKVPHLDVLDGLRGIAILLVVAFHYVDIVQLFRIGWIGVDLFFVLSGFLITGKLVESFGRKGYLSGFYRNRALRIFPLYYAVLLVFFLGLRWVVSPANLPGLHFYSDHWLSFVLFLQNWSLIFFGFPKEVYLTHLWSLAVEEQFYLLWPIVIFLFRDRKKLSAGLLVWILAVIAFRIFQYQHYPLPADSMHYYCNSFCRSDSFVIGGMAFFLYERKDQRLNHLYIYILAFSLLVFFLGILLLHNARFDSLFFATIGYTVNAVLFASMILCALRYPASRVAGWLRHRVLRYFGKISYGIYIFHLPVLLILGSHIHRWMISYLEWNEMVASTSSITCSLIASVSVSAVSYRYYESYFLRLKKRAI